jgi:hypothetical protein
MSILDPCDSQTVECDVNTITKTTIRPPHSQITTEVQHHAITSLRGQAATQADHKRTTTEDAEKPSAKTPKQTADAIGQLRGFSIDGVCDVRLNKTKVQDS